jgi:hypothetical protein
MAPDGLAPEMVVSLVAPQGRVEAEATAAVVSLCVAMPLLDPDTALVTACVTSSLEMALEDVFVDVGKDVFGAVLAGALFVLSLLHPANKKAMPKAIAISTLAVLTLVITDTFFMRLFVYYNTKV